MAETSSVLFSKDNKELLCSILGGKKLHSNALHYLLRTVGIMMLNEDKREIRITIKSTDKKCKLID